MDTASVGLVHRVENMVGDTPNYREELNRRHEHALTRIGELEAVADEPFEHTDTLRDKRHRLDTLTAALQTSADSPEAKAKEAGTRRPGGGTGVIGCAEGGPVGLSGTGQSEHRADRAGQRHRGIAVVRGRQTRPGPHPAGVAHRMGPRPRRGRGVEGHRSAQHAESTAGPGGRPAVDEGSQSGDGSRPVAAGGHCTGRPRGVVGGGPRWCRGVGGVGAGHARSAGEAPPHPGGARLGGGCVAGTPPAHHPPPPMVAPCGKSRRTR